MTAADPSPDASPATSKASVPGSPPRLTDADYRRLFAFRSELRDFLRWSEHAAEDAGLTPSLHQLLLAVRGHPDALGPTIGDAAEALHIRHHSAVELAQRAEASGLLLRTHDPTDQRRMRLALTGRGREHLEELTRAHLQRIGPLAATLETVAERGDDGVVEPEEEGQR